MKKMIFLGILLGVCLLVAGHEPETAWADDAAAFRLAVRLEKSGHVHYIGLGRLLLPARLDAGVRVYDAVGRPLPYFLSGRYGLFLPARLEGEAYVYFGFSDPQPGSSWLDEDGPEPPEAELEVKIVNAGQLAPSESDWVVARNAAKYRQLFRRYENSEKTFWRLLRERMFMPVSAFRYPAEPWVAMQQCRSKLRFDRQLLQFRSKAIRPKQRPPRIDLYYPVWFLPQQLRYYQARMNSALGGMRNLQRSVPREYDQITADAAGAPDREIQEIFFNPKAVVRGEGAVREILLPKRPFDHDGNMAVRYSGRLWIDADGEYEFGAAGNSLLMLLLDEKKILSRYGVIRPAEVKMNRANLKLKRGLYDFRLYYHKSRVTANIAGYIRRPGEPELRLLNDTDFRPGYPVTPLELSGRDGSRYPILGRSCRYRLHTGKLEKFDLESYRPLAPADLDYQLELDGEIFSGRAYPLLPLPVDRNFRLRLLPARPDFRELEVFRYPEAAPLLALDAGITQKLWLPRCIYSDEKLDAYWELQSRLPAALAVNWEIRPNREQAMFPAGPESVSLPAKPLESADRFSPEIVVKRRIPLDGAVLAKGLEVVSRVSLPGVIFDRRDVRFLPADRLPVAELRSGVDGFLDGAGRRIVPVLKRPNLHQLREWELPRKLKTGVTPIARSLIIGEDFGGGADRFSDHLAGRDGEQESGCSFLPLLRHGRISGSFWLDSLPRLFRHLDAAAVERVIILPPSPVRDPGLSERELLRTLALLLERLRNNPAVRDIRLATPLPSPREPDREPEAAFSAGLRQLAREYGVPILELNAAVRALPDWPKLYRFPDAGEDTIDSNLPESGSRTIAEVLSRLLD